MRQRSVIDWGPIEAEYAKGIPPQILATRFNVNPASIRSHVARFKLATYKQQSLKRVAEAHRAATNEMVGEAQSYLSRLKKQVEGGMNALEAEAPATRGEVEEHFTALEKVNRVATTAFGLSEGSKTQTVNIAVLQQLPQDSVSVTASNPVITV
jgi:HAMP domain-containing protein